MSFFSLSRDASTGAQNTIDYEHHEIHGGSAYFLSDTQALATATYKWGLVTPNTTKWLHLIFGAIGTGELLLEFIEDPATFSGGGALTPRNANRNSVNVSGATCTGGITSTGGTTLWTARFGATGAGSAADSSQGAGGRAEFILKQNEQYVFQLTSFAAITGSLELAWYEHTDKA